MFDRLELWKEQKRKLKLKYDDIAALSNIPKGTIQNIFAGYIDNPRIDTVQAIERALGLSEWSAEEKAPPVTDEVKELLSSFNQLPPEGKDAVLRLIRSYLQ